MLETDLDEVLLWRNHPDVRQFMFTQHEISFAEHMLWFQKYQQDSRKKLLIYEEGEIPMGFVSLTWIGNGKVADWGFYTAPGAPKGTGRHLGETALDYSFNVAGLHKVCGQALAFNKRSIRFHRSLGFEHEGTLRKQYFDGSVYHDVLCFGLLRNEWRTDN